MFVARTTIAEKDRATNASDMNGRTVDDSDRAGRVRPDGGQAGRVMRALAAARPPVPGHRAIKSSLAVGIAWWLCTLIGEPLPLFAALGALVSMEATVAGSLRRVGLQVAGMMGGIALAVLINSLLGVNAVGVGLAVLLGLWLGRWVGSPDRVGVELGVTTLLVVAFGGGDPLFAVTRIWETVLGGAVAVAINALIWPPNYLGLVADDLHMLVTRTAAGLREATRTFAERPNHEGIKVTLERLRANRATIPELRADLGLAGTALRLSPLISQERATLERFNTADGLYEKAVRHAVTLARLVEQHAERDHPWAHDGLAAPRFLVDAAEALSHALERYEAYVRTGTQESLPEVGRDLDRTRAALAACLRASEQDRDAGAPIQRIVDVGAIAAELEHLTGDVAAVLDLLPYRQMREEHPVG